MMLLLIFNYEVHFKRAGMFGQQDILSSGAKESKDICYFY